MDRKKEFRDAVRRTSKYLLSHHRPERQYRCYSLSFFGREVQLCARCAGIYPGLALGAIAALRFDRILPVTVVAALVLPTFIEKYLTGIREYRGFNTVRTATGLMLGFAYSQALIMMSIDPARPVLLATGVIYIVGALLLARRQLDRGNF